MHDQFCSYQIIIFIGDFRFGGAEVVGVNLANAFVAHGLHVRLIVLRKDGSLLPRLNRKVEIISLETKIITALPKLLKQLIALNSKPTILISSIRNLNILVGISKILLRLSNTKVIMREANTYRQLWTGGFFVQIHGLAYKLIIPPIYGLADIVIANSCDTKTDLERMGVEKKQRNISVIGNPVVTNYLDDKSRKKSHSKHDLRILSVEDP